MRLILHTLEKDLRRLWPVAVVTWLMLAFLARADRWRFDWAASSTESLLGLLLAMAAAVLAALAVLEEPLVGETNFWTTRPHRWPELLGAKLAFVAVVIHLPWLLADIFVLTARGFSPFRYLGVLLGKQLLYFAAGTLPCMAVATLVRSFTNFVIVMFAILTAVAAANQSAAGAILVLKGYRTFPNYLLPEIGVRDAAIRVLLGIVAVTVIWMQYSLRRVGPARVMAIAAMLAAGSISTWLPARAEYAAVSRPAAETPRILLRDTRPAEPFNFNAQGRTALLPIEVVPSAPGQILRLRLTDVEIVEANGNRIRANSLLRPQPFTGIDLVADAYPYGQSAWPGRTGEYPLPRGLTLSLSVPLWERLKTARVRIHGTMAFDLIRRGSTTALPLDGVAEIPDIGRCATSQVMESQFSEGITLLKVFCESPREFPLAMVVMRHQPSGREWHNRLLDAGDTWLSPLHRARFFFRLSDSVPASPVPWLVPTSYLPDLRLEITPEFVTGHALATFDFPDVSLATWYVAPRSGNR